jgi:hypothetical protein
VTAASNVDLESLRTRKTNALDHVVDRADDDDEFWRVRERRVEAGALGAVVSILGSEHGSAHASAE